MNETKEWPIDRFLQWVAEIVRRDDRGTLAELRRGLSETTQDQAWEHLLLHDCPQSDFADKNRRRAWCVIAGLAALLIPKGLNADATWHNLGTTMRILALGSDGNGAEALKSFEPKFRRILSCDNSQSLCDMVVQVGKAAERKNIAMNLANLFWDIVNWDDINKRDGTEHLEKSRVFIGIRPKWAQQFWGGRMP